LPLARPEKRRTTRNANLYVTSWFHAAIAPMSASDTFDCQRCGACCCNPPDNRAEGFEDWIEIEPRAAILRRKQLSHLLVTGGNGRAHLRVTAEGRCAALEGRLGERVRCTVYHVRPKPCRRVQPGDADCLACREAVGL
jgi:Fe-S-cluster containining protein